MKFHYGMQDMSDLQRAQESSFLLTNGLGGYSSMTVAFSAPRCDQGILEAAVKKDILIIEMLLLIIKFQYTL